MTSFTDLVDDVILLLLKAKGVDPNWHDYNIPPPIVCAAEHGHAEVVELMLRDGRADPNATCRYGVNALEFASMCSRPNAECIGLLQADPRVDAHAADDEGRTALHMAAKYGHTENVQWLLDAGLDPNHQDKDGKTPLAHATEGIAVENIDVLLRSPGVDPNTRGRSGHTPLMRATERRRWEAVKRLLADPRVLPDLAIRNGTTPLMVACRDNMTYIAEAILARPDLDLGLKNDKGRTALHFAVRMGRYEIVAMLRERGRLAGMVAVGGPHPIDEVNKKGRNAMSTAAACGPEWLFEFLLEIEREVEGVDWMREDIWGRDPAWYARHHNRPRIAEVLEEEWSKRGRRPSASLPEDSNPSPS